MSQDADGVTVACRDRTAVPRSFRCTYLVACDGGNSELRDALGIRFEGDAEVTRSRSVFFRAPGLTPRPESQHLHSHPCDCAIAAAAIRWADETNLRFDQSTQPSWHTG